MNIGPCLPSPYGSGSISRHVERSAASKMTRSGHKLGPKSRNAAVPSSRGTSHRVRKRSIRTAA